MTPGCTEGVLLHFSLQTVGVGDGSGPEASAGGGLDARPS